MNQESGDRLLDLTIKELAGRAAPEEQAELREAIASEPGLDIKHAELRGRLLVARDILSLVAAADVSGPGLVQEQTDRIRAAVKEQFPAPVWLWRFVLLLIVLFGAYLAYLVWPAKTIVEIAWIDIGFPHVSAANRTQDLSTIRDFFSGAQVVEITDRPTLERWRTRWPEGSAPKFKIECENTTTIVPPAAPHITSIRVEGKTRSGAPLTNITVVALTNALFDARRFIHQTER